MCPHQISSTEQFLVIDVVCILTLSLTGIKRFHNSFVRVDHVMFLSTAQ